MRRRLELGITSRRDLAERTKALARAVPGAAPDAKGVGERTIADLELGTTAAGVKTKLFVEKALGWAPGSCNAILMGGEPTVLDPDTPPVPSPAKKALTAAFELADDEDLEELLTYAREVADRRRAERNVNPGGRSSTTG